MQWSVPGIHTLGRGVLPGWTKPTPLWRVRKSMLYELNLMKPFPLTPCFCCIQCWFFSSRLSGFMGWFGHLLTERLVKTEGFLIVWCCWLGWPNALLLISPQKLFFSLSLFLAFRLILNWCVCCKLTGVKHWKQWCQCVQFSQSIYLFRSFVVAIWETPENCGFSVNK